MDDRCDIFDFHITNLILFGIKISNVLSIILICDLTFIQPQFTRNKMTSIRPANTTDFKLLAEIGRQTFIEAHHKSAAQSDIDFYVDKKYNPDTVFNELENPDNIYHLIYHNTQPAGYSKIILNSGHSNIKNKNVTKLERLYLLKEFYELKLGKELFNFNVDLSKKNNQSGMWLFVWKGNERAIRFYEKTGFKIIGSYDFEISPTHSNPNHQLFLEY